MGRGDSSDLGALLNGGVGARTTEETSARSRALPDSPTGDQNLHFAGQVRKREQIPVRELSQDLYDLARRVGASSISGERGDVHISIYSDGAQVTQQPRDLPFRERPAYNAAPRRLAHYVPDELRSFSEVDRQVVGLEERAQAAKHFARHFDFVRVNFSDDSEIRDFIVNGAGDVSVEVPNPNRRFLKPKTITRTF